MMFASVAAGGVAATLIAWLAAAIYERRAAENFFALAASRRAAGIEQECRTTLSAIEHLASFLSTSPELNARQFRHMASLLLARHTSVQSISWAPRVTRDGREAYERQAALDTGQAIVIREWTTSGAIGPAAPRDVHFPIRLVESESPVSEISPISELVGLDLGTHPLMSGRLQEAHDAGAARLSTVAGRRGAGDLFAVLGAAGESTSPEKTATTASTMGDASLLLAVAPAFSSDRSESGSRQESQVLAGYVISDLNVDELVRRSGPSPVRGASEPMFAIRLVAVEDRTEDAAAGGRPSEAKAPLADGLTRSSLSPLASLGNLRYSQTFDSGGQHWTVTAAPTAAFLARTQSWRSQMVLISGLFFTAMALALVALLSGRTERVERMVGLRDDELARARGELRLLEEHRQRAEAALQDIEARYRSLVESLPLNVFQKDLEGRLVFANLRYCEDLGKSLDELIGKTDYDLFPRALAQKYRDDDRRAIEEGVTLEDVEQHLSPDGERKYVHVFKAPLRSGDGRVIGVQGLFWDVTDRYRAEEAQRMSDARFRKLVDSNVLGVMTCTLDGRILEANDALLKMVGYSREDLENGELRWDRITPPEHRAADERAIETLLKTGVCPPWEKEYVRKDGGRTPVLLGVTMLEGSQVECISFVLDISERKQAEVLLRAAQQAALAASEAKSRFLANMSHEIRTPLNGIIGLTELVLKTSLTAEQEEYLSLVRQSGESLLAIINDVLDYSKVEAGKLELYQNVFELREHLGDAMKSLAIRAHEKGLELVCDISPDTPEAIVGDAGRLRQIVLNLVGNAIKFTDEGEVVLRVAPALPGETALDQPPPEGQIDLHFSVSDTGLGIPDDKREIIFHAFEQADSASTRRFGGTGLGLAISSALVRLMNGRIWVESQVGKGSVFHFLARFQTAEAPARVDPDAIAGAKVLIVDDNSTNRRILQQMTRNWRLEPTVVSSADEALAALRAAQSQGAPFRLILTDSQMPGVDGFSFAERIRQHPELDGGVIMMLTSGARPGDVARCEQLGISAYLMKPIKQSELFDAIALALSTTSAGGVSERSSRRGREVRPSAPKIGRLRILLAEDSLVNQKLALGLLTREGHSVKVASNGREAAAFAEIERFDVILMDVQMPEMDGLEATRLIRGREKKTNEHTPIMAMTAHAMQGDRERCLAAGMDDYISKPIQAELLWRKLAALAQGEAVAPTDTAQAESAISSVNWSEALAAVNQDRDLLCEVIDAFLSEAPKLLSSISAAIAERDAELLHRSAHTLKGNMRFFGVVSAVEPALSLEQMGKKEQFTEACEVFAVLEKEMNRLLPALREFLGRPA